MRRDGARRGVRHGGRVQRRRAAPRAGRRRGATSSSALDRLLEPYGGLGAIGRDGPALAPDRSTHEINQLRADRRRPAVDLPGVAAFILNVVLRARWSRRSASRSPRSRRSATATARSRWHYLKSSSRSSARSASPSASLLGAGWAVHDGALPDFFRFPLCSTSGCRLGVVLAPRRVTLAAAARARSRRCARVVRLRAGRGDAAARARRATGAPCIERLGCARRCARRRAHDRCATSSASPCARCSPSPASRWRCAILSAGIVLASTRSSYMIDVQFDSAQRAGR